MYQPASGMQCDAAKPVSFRASAIRVHRDRHYDDRPQPYTNFGVVDRKTTFGETGLEFPTKLLSAAHPAPPFAEWSEIWPVEVESGRVVFAALPSVRFYNPLGTVHGGWISTLLDTAMLMVRRPA